MELKHFTMLQNSSYVPITYMWHILLFVVLLNSLQVFKGRLCDAKFHLLDAQPFLCFLQRYGVAITGIHEPLRHRLYEPQFLCCSLIILKSLNDGYTTATTGKKDGAVRILSPANHLSRVDLQV